MTPAHLYGSPTKSDGMSDVHNARRRAMPSAIGHSALRQRPPGSPGLEPVNQVSPTDSLRENSEATARATVGCGDPPTGASQKSANSSAYESAVHYKSKFVASLRGKMEMQGKWGTSWGTSESRASEGRESTRERKARPVMCLCCTLLAHTGDCEAGKSSHVLMKEGRHPYPPSSERALSLSAI